MFYILRLQVETEKGILDITILFIVLSYLLAHFSGQVLAVLGGDGVRDGLADLLQHRSTLLPLHLSADLVVNCPALPLSPEKYKI